MRRPASPPRPAVRSLAGPELELYCSTAAALIEGGRLSRSYPDPVRCGAFLRALAPSARGAHAAPVEVDLRSGLPSLKEIVGVQADAKLADAFLREAAARPANRPLTPAAQAKAAYYAKLRELPLGGAVWTLEAKLRRVDEKAGTAAFEVVYDRYDPAEHVFVRHTILLEQRDELWGESFLHRRGDYSAQTDAFREKMERYTQDDSELAFLLLGRVPGLRVEEVVRGRVGPLWSPWAPAPEEFRGSDPAFILHLPLDRASLTLAGDRSDDPFSTIYRRFLSEDSRALVEEEAHRLGYRVHKDRKFVATKGAGALVEERLARAGTRNIVYEI